MRFGALIIGDEILSGRRQDKHLSQLITLLSTRGLRLSWAEYVGDDPTALSARLQRSFDSGDIVFSFGGIGSTPDDHTRQAAADALGLPLELHPEAEQEIRARFGSEITPQRLQMGFYPQGSSIIPNPYNRIPGFSIQQHYFVPGFPVMAWPMVEWVLDKCYPHLHDQDDYVEDSVYVVETFEGQIVDLMQQITATYPDATLFSLPSFGDAEIPQHIELGMKGPHAVVAQAMTALTKALHERGHICEKTLTRRRSNA